MNDNRRELQWYRNPDFVHFSFSHTNIFEERHSFRDIRGSVSFFQEGVWLWMATREKFRVDSDYVYGESETEAEAKSEVEKAVACFDADR